MLLSVNTIFRILMEQLINLSEVNARPLSSNVPMMRANFEVLDCLQHNKQMRSQFDHPTILKLNIIIRHRNIMIGYD